MSVNELVASGRMWLVHMFEVTLGTRMRQLGTLLAAMMVAFVWVNLGDEPEVSTEEQAEMQRAINLAHFFEAENRTLKIEYENERRLREVSDRTITALSELIREQDEEILNQEQQLAFYRQLLEERGNPEDEIRIRTFEIVPDFRENHYQLLAVLVRGGAGESFSGMLDLALSLRDSGGAEFEHRPVFDLGALDTEFLYYLEFQAGFSIPPGTEILNGQLALFREDGELMVSRILADEVP